MLYDLYPLLRTVQPAELNTTLTAIATALEGRGERIGENLDTLDAYLKRINPQIPDADRGPRADRAGVRRLRGCGAARSPSPAQHASRPRRPSRAARQAAKRCSATSQRSPTPHGTFLDENGDNLIRLGELGQTQTGALRQVRPRVPLPARRHRQRGQAPGRGVPRLHVAHQPRAAAQPAARLHPRATSPQYGENSGPHCGRLPNPPWNQTTALPAPAQFRRRRRRAHWQGHQPGCAQLRARRGRRVGYAGSAAESVAPQRPARPGTRPARRRRRPTSDAS